MTVYFYWFFIWFICFTNEGSKSKLIETQLNYTTLNYGKAIQLRNTKNLFEMALAAESVTGQLAEVSRSIYKQESGAGSNTKTSNAGAVGGMQIIPSTFKSVADKGWDINDPLLNARAGIRYIKQLDKQSGGDPALTAAGYYGGPGGMEKARRGIAVSDPRNPKAPTTLEYGRQVAARLGKDPAYLAQSDNQFAKQSLPAVPRQIAASAPQIQVPIQQQPVMQPVPVEQMMAAAQPQAPMQEPAPVMAQAPQMPDQWQEFLNNARQLQSQPVQVADINYGLNKRMPQIQVPDFMAAVNPGQNQNASNFQMLQALQGWS